MSASNEYCAIEVMLKEMKIKESDSALSRVATPWYGSESGSSAPRFSQLVLVVPAEINSFCLSFLWTLRDTGMVLDWHWEDGILQVLADIDLILSRTSVPEGVPNSWLLRLIEAAQHPRCFPCPHTDDLATDFSYLCCDPHQCLLQSA